MLNNIIRLSFAVVGAITGFTLVRTLVISRNAGLGSGLKTIIYIIVSVCVAVLFYSVSKWVIAGIHKIFDRSEALVREMSAYELVVSCIGLVMGLLVANLITIPVNRLEIIGAPISILVNILFGYLGVTIALTKKSDDFFEIFDAIKNRNKHQKSSKYSIQSKILDTSVIIDGRIVDICKAGFIEGEFIVPSFVLEELRHIADSADALKRNRGRRGLDILAAIQKEHQYPVKIENIQLPEGSEVDNEILKLAKQLGSKVLTTDYNLNKVASLQGIQVLNVNELSNAVKPIALAGEEMVVQVIKDGKENGQGVAYTDDGTMIVVEGGKKHIGESINVVVTSILQTSAGRMIFAKPAYTSERAI